MDHRRSFYFKDKNKITPYCCCQNCKNKEYKLNGEVNISRDSSKCVNCLYDNTTFKSKLTKMIYGITFIKKYDYAYNGFEPWPDLLLQLKERMEFLKEEDFEI